MTEISNWQRMNMDVLLLNNRLWDHGDFRDGALYYVQDVFHKIVTNGNLK